MELFQIELFVLTASSGSKSLHGVLCVITRVFSVWRVCQGKGVSEHPWSGVLWFMAIAWSSENVTSYVSSPLQKQGKRIFLKFKLKESDNKKEQFDRAWLLPHLHLWLKNPCLICIPPHLRNFRARSLPPRSFTLRSGVVLK